MSATDPDPVSIGDLEVADRIARAVRRGRPADRHPTLEQILAAFGEAEATPGARRRAARALALAGIAAVPDLLEAAPGERLVLEVRRPRKRRALLLGALALVALFGAVVAAASTVDLGNDTTGDLPPATTTTTATAPTTTTDPTPTQGTTPTATTPALSTAAERRKAKRARERRAREQRARQRRRRAKASARRRVTVRLNARQPTFLCVEGDGRQLFDGTLSGSRTFRGRVVRLNVGLGPSTQVTANGKAVRLTASPTGIELTPTERRFLALGARPCA